MVRRGGSQRARARTTRSHAPAAPPASPPKPDSRGPESRGGGFPARSAVRRRETKSQSLTAEHMKGRLAIKVVTMNLSGQSVMGLTPAYKLNYIREYVETMPDVVFIQDGIRDEDLSNILDGASEGKYSYEFQKIHRKDSNKDEDKEDKRRSPMPAPPLTAIVWNTEKYHGSPLELDDSRLGKLATWVKSHNLTVVKLDCTTRVGFQDVYPSFIAMSWHGKDYDTTLRDRTDDVKEFLDFVSTLRSNNLQIPILVGGDFNMDMKSYDMSDYKDLSIVPYRPLSGKNVMRDLRNTFLFTMDALQITETHYKQFHPDIFHSPWVSVQVKGRVKLHLWAVVKIQRWFRKFKIKKATRSEAKKKVSNTKERWRKKAEGEQYRPPPPDPPQKKPLAPRDRDTSYGESRPESRDEEAEYMSRRRTDFMDQVGEETDYVKHFYDNQKNSKGAVGAVYRRKRYDDLKSVQERKDDSKQIESWLNM